MQENTLTIQTYFLFFKRILQNFKHFNWDVMSTIDKNLYKSEVWLNSLPLNREVSFIGRSMSRFLCQLDESFILLL